MHRFSITVEIAAPPARVWEVMADGERWPEWTASVTSVRLLGARKLEVGARAWIKQPKFPPALWKVTELRPGQGFTWVSVAPGLRVTASHSVEAIPSGTLATLSVEYRGLLGGWLARMTRDVTERYLALEADGLKMRSEGR